MMGENLPSQQNKDGNHEHDYILPSASILPWTSDGNNSCGPMRTCLCFPGHENPREKCKHLANILVHHKQSPLRRRLRNSAIPAHSRHFWSGTKYLSENKTKQKTTSEKAAFFTLKKKHLLWPWSDTGGLSLNVLYFSDPESFNAAPIWKKTLAEGSKKLRVSHGMENLGRATKLAYRSGKVYPRALCTQKMCVWVIRCLVNGDVY